MKKILALCFGLLLPSAAAAEATSPYAGWAQRDIKAMSVQQIDDLRAGRGMSLALAAELNGYPGPRHVLDLGAALDLSPAQRDALEGLFGEMQAAAQRLGSEIIAAEAGLEQTFRGGGADDTDLRRRLADLGALRGELRYTHLRSHLAAKALLSPAQLARYDDLRGYTGPGPEVGPAGRAAPATPGGHDGHDGHGTHGPSAAE